MKLEMNKINSQQHFVELFKKYSKDSLGWIYTGNNPFELKGKSQRMNPNLENALMMFSQNIKDFDGDFVDLYEWFEELE